MDEMELFASGIEAGIKVERKSRERKAQIEPPSRSSLLDESPWKRTRGVALVHADSETLLGNFSEYLHPSGARRLVRETWPLSISAVERVEGSWWLGTERRPEERQEWHTQRSVIMHLHLEPLGVHAPAVELVVHLSYGGIARCDLKNATLFTATTAPLTLLELQAGTNILEVMSLDMKIKLRQEIGL